MHSAAGMLGVPERPSAEAVLPLLPTQTVRVQVLQSGAQIARQAPGRRRRAGPLDEPGEDMDLRPVPLVGCIKEASTDHRRHRY